jgi:2-C-methyl-D-erythritol 4-phosphate cytidylyltransferase/2-C-methyl-D-erythritol 2,4-cyclodiphosphate synthase
MSRVGLGFDSHRFQPGRPLVLAGVRIPHEAGLAGHSDGDAVLHAVTDAILGALAAGDIGEHFPDSDPKWAGADSSQFVEHAVRLAAERGQGVVNVDVTVLAERPKLVPHKAAMRQRIAGLLRIDASTVSVKAKTGEGLGFVGSGEGIAALVVVLMGEK